MCLLRKSIVFVDNLRIIDARSRVVVSLGMGKEQPGVVVLVISPFLFGGDRCQAWSRICLSRGSKLIR